MTDANNTSRLIARRIRHRRPASPEHRHGCSRIWRPERGRLPKIAFLSGADRSVREPRSC
jgi:hypothetical protein